MDVLTTQLETSVDGDNTITVEITDDSQQVNQRKSIIITTHSPRLSFYELHPLEGPKYQRQVMDGYTIHPGITTQILAIPFFLNLNISKEFSYTWKVNSTLVPGNINPKILNFNTADGSLGDAIIDLTMQSPRSIFEQAQHTTTIHVQ